MQYPRSSLLSFFSSVIEFSINHIVSKCYCAKMARDWLSETADPIVRLDRVGAVAREHGLAVVVLAI